MIVRVFDLHALEDLIVTSNEQLPVFKLVKAEEVSLSEEEIGIILPVSTLQRQGVVYSGGWIRPGWSGQVVIEMCVMRECVIRKGDAIAHVIVFSLNSKCPKCGSWRFFRTVPESNVYVCLECGHREVRQG